MILYHVRKTPDYAVHDFLQLTKPNDQTMHSTIIFYVKSHCLHNIAEDLVKKVTSSKAISYI